MNKPNQYISVKVTEEMRSAINKVVVAKSVERSKPVKISEVVKEALEEYINNALNTQNG